MSSWKCTEAWWTTTARWCGSCPRAPASHSASPRTRTMWWRGSGSCADPRTPPWPRRYGRALCAPSTETPQPGTGFTAQICPRTDLWRSNTSSKCCSRKRRKNLNSLYLVSFQVVDIDDVTTLSTLNCGGPLKVDIFIKIYVTYLRIHSENQHLAWRLDFFLGDFLCLSWASITCNWAEILICWSQSLRE